MPRTLFGNNMYTVYLNNIAKYHSYRFRIPIVLSMTYKYVHFALMLPYTATILAALVCQTEKLLQYHLPFKSIYRPETFSIDRSYLGCTAVNISWSYTR